MLCPPSVALPQSPGQMLSPHHCLRVGVCTRHQQEKELKSFAGNRTPHFVSLFRAADCAGSAGRVPGSARNALVTGDLPVCIRGAVPASTAFPGRPHGPGLSENAPAQREQGTVPTDRLKPRASLPQLRAEASGGQGLPAGRQEGLALSLPCPGPGPCSRPLQKGLPTRAVHPGKILQGRNPLPLGDSHPRLFSELRKLFADVSKSGSCPEPCRPSLLESPPSPGKSGVAEGSGPTTTAGVGGQRIGLVSPLPPPAGPSAQAHPGIPSVLAHASLPHPSLPETPSPHSLLIEHLSPRRICLRAGCHVPRHLSCSQGAAWPGLCDTR